MKYKDYLTHFDKMKIRVATFNVENLFARYKFAQNFSPNLDDGFMINNTAFTINDEEAKRITAKTIRKSKADILCLQEVEGLKVLDHFNSKYLAGCGYKYRLLIDSHDPRHLDVAFLSKFPINNICSYRNERNERNTSWLFSRDCLTVDVIIQDKTLRIYNNHFKSMIGGREKTHERRLEQSDRVAKIVEDDWRSINYMGNFIVVGDLNDYPNKDTALLSLINHKGLNNVVNRLLKEERWTHFYKKQNIYSQLDYIFLSKGLEEKNKDEKPKILRNGMPYRVEKYSGERFENIGEDSPKASDHALVYIDLNLL